MTRLDVYLAGNKPYGRPLGLICLLNLQRAGPIDLLDAALDEPPVLRRFRPPRSTAWWKELG